MAVSSYFLIFTIIFQITTLALCVDVGSTGGVSQFGFGDVTSRVRNPNYRNNVNSLFSILVSESSRGYFNTSTGEGSDRAYGTYLCRGDLSAEECHTCLEEVRDFTVNPIRIYYSDTIVFKNQLHCIVQFANSSSPFVYRENSTLSGQGFGDRLAQHPQYNTTLFNTLNEVAREAGYGNWTRPNFETKVVNVAGTENEIHLLVQCTPDISAMNCSNCLSNLYGVFTPYAIGGDILGRNCLLTYNNEPLSTGSAYHNFMPNFYVFLIFLWTTYLTFL